MHLTAIYNKIAYNLIILNSKGKEMPVVKLSEKIVSDAKNISKTHNRSVSKQIEHWAKIGKIAEENSDLTYEFIKDILIAQQEAHAEKLIPYTKKK